MTATPNAIILSQGTHGLYQSCRLHDPQTLEKTASRLIANELSPFSPDASGKTATIRAFRALERRSDASFAKFIAPPTPAGFPRLSL